MLSLALGLLSDDRVGAVMRRILIGVTLASIALAAAILLSRSDPPTENRPFRIELTELDEAQRLSLEADLQRLQDAGAIYFDPRISPIDPGISAMDCRVVTEEPLGGNRFLLTEECTWRGVVVEQRRFQAFRKEDGPSYGWMYRPTESDT